MEAEHARDALLARRKEHACWPVKVSAAPLTLKKYARPPGRGICLVMRTGTTTGTLGTAVETVLVVESEAITRYCWSEALRGRGYDVLDVQDPSEALQRTSPNPDLLTALIVEISFSQLEGNRLARFLKESNPKLCVIASSTFRPRDLPDDLRYDAVLEKPVTPKQMLALVEQLLHRANAN